MARPPAPGLPLASWVDLGWRRGFVLVFATFAMVAGGVIGWRLVESQVAIVDRLTRIELYQQQHVTQMDEMNRRLVVALSGSAAEQGGR